MTAQQAHVLTNWLETNHMDLISMTNEYILIRWPEDASYVSWLWSIVDNKFVVNCGNYLNTDRCTEKEALKAFIERINK